MSERWEGAKTRDRKKPPNAIASHRPWFGFGYHGKVWTWTEYTHMHGYKGKRWNL